MPTVSLSRRIDQHRRQYQAAGCSIELGIEVVAPDGQVVMAAGGAWNVTRRAYLPSTARAHRIRLVSSQLQAAMQLASWFASYDRDDPERMALEVYVDQRRGGKSFFIFLAIFLFSLRTPRSAGHRTVCWIVVPTYPQQREIHEVITAILPRAWFTDRRVVYHKAENYYALANGTSIYVKSADRAAGLKAGGVAAVAVNEAQQIEARGILNVLGANIDGGGITFLAMNPPDTVKGLWAENLHDAIGKKGEDGKPVLPFARETAFPARLNEVIDQQARTRYAMLAAVIDPKQAQRDVLGIWLGITDKAYPFYKRELHYGPEPVGWEDFTVDANQHTYMLSRGDNRAHGAGMDFQLRPWCAYGEAKVLIAPPGHPAAGLPVYVINFELCNDKNIGEFWTEDLLCMKIASSLKLRGLSPKNFLLIADGTGHHQGSSGEQRGKDSDPATYSWAIVQRAGWEPHAAQERTRLAGDKGPATRILHYSNPPVPVRLNLMNELFRLQRIIITTKAPETADSFRMCGVRHKKPFGDGAHRTDAMGYLIYTWETALREAGIVKIEDAA